MFVGTSSDVGKSVIAAGFCRVFKQDGFQPAPFKGQNMSLNSFATPEGLEIGRAQAMQAEACGISCHTDMNPVLLKPTGDRQSQVVLNGKPVGNQTAKEFFLANNREELFRKVRDAFDSLTSKYSPIVLEGAGSISELNLKARDITNMKMAKYADASTYLITDIERGGVFGSLFGTISLLEPEERALIKGIIINKFRGDIDLFHEGRKMIEELCKVPVVGVMPYFKDIFLEEEDSVSLMKKKKRSIHEKINVAVILLEHISNFTDFARLEQDTRINLFYTKDPGEILKADIVILPGTKNTIDDLVTIRNNGIAKAIYKVFKRGKTVIGICGGYQMLGEKVCDPEGLESEIKEIAGLGILPVETILLGEKITRQRSFTFKDNPVSCVGYEIHMGISKPVNGSDKPLCIMDGSIEDGYYLNKNCWGTYLHGILDNQTVIEDLLSDLTSQRSKSVDYKKYKDQQYDKLADWIRHNIDMKHIYDSIQP